MTLADDVARNPKVRDDLRAALASALELGELLLENQRHFVPEGEWGGWVDSNFMLGRSQAYLMMQLAAHRQDHCLAPDELVDGLLDDVSGRTVPDLIALCEEHGADRDDGPRLDRLMLQAAAAQLPPVDLSDGDDRWWET